MKKIYVVIKEKFPTEPVLYMAKYLGTYAQRNSVFFFVFLFVFLILPLHKQ